ncbi:hypothetical protein ACFL6H_10210, partial [Candidatus Latescibacterota bacterium]
MRTKYMHSRQIVFIEILLFLLLSFSVLSYGNIETPVNGTIRVYLYESGTGTDRGGNNHIYASIGDTISVDVFIRNSFREAVTSLSFYM